jgi:hypothetical protein
MVAHADFMAIESRIALDPDNYGLLKELIDETYIDGIDRIEGAWAVGDYGIEAIAWDENRQFVVTIDGDDLSILQTNDEAHTPMPYTASFAAAKKRNCKVGITCGGTCIAKGKTCHKKASAGQKEKAKKLISSALVHVPKNVDAKTGIASPTKSSGHDEIGFWLLDKNFDRSKYSDLGVPSEATKSTAVANAYYKQLAAKYHPDKGGNAEQMANVNRLRDQMLAMAEMNESFAADAAAKAAKKAAKAAKGK